MYESDMCVSVYVCECVCDGGEVLVCMRLRVICV